MSAESPPPAPLPADPSPIRTPATVGEPVTIAPRPSIRGAMLETWLRYGPILAGTAVFYVALRTPAWFGF